MMMVEVAEVEAVEVAVAAAEAEAQHSPLMLSIPRRWPAGKLPARYSFRLNGCLYWEPNAWLIL